MAIHNPRELHDRRRAYIVYGISDSTKEVIGTTVRLKKERVGAEIFENWLARLLDPHVVVEFSSCDYDGRRVEIASIDPAYVHPVKFKGRAYIRIDSVKKPLDEFPDRERSLWALTARYKFEDSIAASQVSAEAIFEDFDCDAFASTLYAKNLTKKAILEFLLKDSLILDDGQGCFDVTNLFAILAAKDISKYRLLSGKAPRVISYIGTSKLKGIDDVTGRFGYVRSFPKLLNYVMTRTPHAEIFRHGVRVTEYAFPPDAVREFIANALIHQDLSAAGGYPLIEIYEDRMQITNPGVPLIATDRFIDAPPKSRNERLAGFMRKAGFCEERGSGVDRALFAIEERYSAPPLFQVVENSTVVTLYADKTFGEMSKEAKLRACYQHACLRFCANDYMSNASLRNRFGLSQRQYPQVSVVIREAIDAKLIRPLDADQANRLARYVPFWV